MALTSDRTYISLGAGINEVIGGLILNGETKAAGTYGATGSGATNIFDEYFAGSGIVTVGGSLLAADFNNSGGVNATDLTAWRGGFGTTGQPKSSGDATGEGTVDGGDFLVWQQQFNGGAAVPAAAGVPEPSAALLALLIAPLATMIRRKGQ